MPSGPFLDETVDALLLGAVFGPAGKADSVSFRLAPAGLRWVFEPVVGLRARGLSVAAVRLDGRRCCRQCC